MENTQIQTSSDLQEHISLYEEQGSFPPLMLCSHFLSLPSLSLSLFLSISISISVSEERRKELLRAIWTADPSHCWHAGCWGEVSLGMLNHSFLKKIEVTKKTPTQSPIWTLDGPVFPGRPRAVAPWLALDVPSGRVDKGAQNLWFLSVYLCALQSCSAPRG